MSTIKTNQLAHTANGASVYTLPQTDGSAGQALKTDGSGQLGFANFGKILQVVSVTKTDVSTIATSADTFFNYDDASLKVTLTPSSASNKILLLGDVCVSSNTNVGAMFVRFHKDGSVLTGSVGNASGSRGRMASAAIQHSNNYPTFHSLSFLDTAGNTNSRYYNFGIAQNAGSGRNVQFNNSYSSSDSFGYGLYSSTITAMEIEA